MIVQPEADAAYTIFAQAEDRSGLCAGTLARLDWALTAAVPRWTRVRMRTMVDMGMDMSDARHVGDGEWDANPMPGMNASGHERHEPTLRHPPKDPHEKPDERHAE